MRDETRCTVRQAVETCSSDGVWGGAQPCPFACLDGACVGDCLPKDARCDPARPLTTQTCDAKGHWIDGPVCANLCSKGSCSGSCAPTTRQCGPNNVPASCDANGTWQPEAACDFVCSGAAAKCTGECVPGAKDCDGLDLLNGTGAPRLCGDDATWRQQLSCGARTCAAGACVGECIAGAERCNELTPQTCNASGKWISGGSAACAATNFALGARVTASSQIVYSTFSPQGLVDGRSDTAFSTEVLGGPNPTSTDDPTCPVWVAIEMTTLATFSKVALLPRQDAGDVGSCFPLRFKIQVYDGTSWLTRVDKTLVTVPATLQTYALPKADWTAKVRVCATTLTPDSQGAYRLQFAELQVLP